MAAYKNGGSIVAEYAKRTKEEMENVEALRPIAALGRTVTLVERSKTIGVRTADAIIDGEKWEVKTNYKPTKSAIDNALRSCNGQAKNLIINIQSDITDENLIGGIKLRIHRTDIETIVIVKNGKIVRTIKRKDILK